MKKRLVCVLACLVLLASPSFAFLKLALSGGYVFFNQEGLPSSLDEGGFPAVEARAGIDFGPLNAGLLAAYLPAYDGTIPSYGTYQLAQVPILVFGSLKVPGTGLYLIGGAGFSFYTGDLLNPALLTGISSYSVEDGDFTWMLGAGYQFPLIEIGLELGLDLGLRYYNINATPVQTAWVVQLGAYLSL